MIPVHLIAEVAQPSIVTMLVAAIGGLFGVLVQQIHHQQETSTKEVDAANARTEAVNQTMLEERRRYDELMNRVLGAVEKQSQQVDELAAALKLQRPSPRAVPREERHDDD